jgi:hypothetical protein
MAYHSCNKVRTIPLLYPTTVDYGLISRLRNNIRTAHATPTVTEPSTSVILALFQHNPPAAGTAALPLTSPAYSTTKLPLRSGCVMRTPWPRFSVRNTSSCGALSRWKGLLLHSCPQGQVRGSQWMKDSRLRQFSPQPVSCSEPSGSSSFSTL